MNRPLLKLPQTLICWTVEASHLVNHPQYIEATSLEELRREVQKLADSRSSRDNVPAFGEITFRYETDEADEVVLVQSYFRNRHGNKARFMRLRRKDQS